MGITLVIADDHKIVREGLCSLLNTDNMQVIGEASGGHAAISLTQELSPDVVIMDIAMPDMNGIEAIKQINAANPKVKVLVLSMHSDRRYIYEAFKAGASGYLLKECAFDELIRAIQIVMQNQIFVGARINKNFFEDNLALPHDGLPEKVSNLSNREQEVLGLLVEGMSAKSIASHLAVSTKTVETHRTRIMDKLNIHNMADLTKYAIREGVISLGPEHLHKKVC